VFVSGERKRAKSIRSIRAAALLEGEMKRICSRQACQPLGLSQAHRGTLFYHHHHELSLFVRLLSMHTHIYICIMYIYVWVHTQREYFLRCIDIYIISRERPPLGTLFILLVHSHRRNWFNPELLLLQQRELSSRHPPACSLFLLLSQPAQKLHTIYNPMHTWFLVLIPIEEAEDSKRERESHFSTTTYTTHFPILINHFLVVSSHLVPRRIVDTCTHYLIIRLFLYIPPRCVSHSPVTLYRKKKKEEVKKLLVVLSV